MIEKLWEDTLGSEGLDVASGKEIDQIVNDILVPNRIDPMKFYGNYLAISGINEMPFWTDSSSPVHEPTESVGEHLQLHTRAEIFPEWFCAAFPDIVTWHNEVMENSMTTDDYDPSSPYSFENLWKIKIDAKDEDLMNVRNEAKSIYLKNLIDSYKELRKKELEVTAENTMEDVYAGLEMMDAMGETDNFSCIAKNITKIYLELESNYKERLTNNLSLLAATAFLDAQYYILIEKSIQIQEVLEIAKLANNSSNSILDLVIRLMTKLMEVDNPDIAPDVEDICLSKKDDIAIVIEQVRKEYSSDSQIAPIVREFMTSSKMKPIREQLGISEAKPLFTRLLHMFGNDES